MKALTPIRELTSIALTGILLSQVALAATPPPSAAGDPESVATRVTLYAGPKVDTPRGLDGKPDLSGFWRPVREQGKPGGNLGKDQANFILPFSEIGKRALLYSQNHTIDPEALCIPGGIPRHNGSGLAFEILHTPKRLATLYNYNTHRWVSIGDHLQHSTNPEHRYFGEAIAKWDGDTLVIDTVGLKDSSHENIWLDENGNPTSDQTQVVERWTRPDYHRLTLKMTVTDLKYYTRPFTFTRTWARADKGQGLNEYACNENNLDAEHIGPGAGPVGPDGNREVLYRNEALPEVPPGPEAYEKKP